MHSFRKTILLLCLILILLPHKAASGAAIDDAQRLYKEGTALAQQARYKEARERFEAGLAIVEELKDENSTLAFLLSIGFICSQTADYETALERFQRALAISEELKNKEAQATALGLIGVIYYTRGEYRDALEFCEKTLKIYTELGKRKEEGECLKAKGMIYKALKDYEKALEFYEQSATIYKETGERKKEGEAFAAIASVYFENYVFDKAMDYSRKALPIFEEIGDRKAQGDSLLDIGTIYNKLGDFEKALDYYERSYEIKHETGDRKGEGYSLNNTGLIYFNVGDFEKALRCFQKSLALFKEAGDKEGEAISISNIGIVYDTLGDYVKAIEYTMDSLRICEEIGSRDSEANACNNIGWIYNKMGEYERALEYLEKSTARSKETGNRAGQGLSIANTGYVYYKRGDYGKAVDYFNSALVIFENTGDRIETARTNIGLGMAHYRLGDYRKALDYSNKSLKIYEEFDDPTYEYMNLFNIGLACEGLGEDDRAIDNLIKSVEIIESMRGKLTVEEYKTSYVTEKEKMEIYEKLIQLLIKKKKNEEAWEYTEKAKARTLLDMLRSQKIDIRSGGDEALIKEESELYDRISAHTALLEKEQDAKKRKKVFKDLTNLQKKYEDTILRLKASNPDYASLKTAAISSLKEIQDGLPDTSVILEYFSGRDKTYLFIIGKSSFEVVTLNITGEALFDKISSLCKKIRERIACDDEAASLSRVLLPVEALDAMEGMKQIIVIPHSILHYIPFSLLSDSKGDNLVKRFEIQTEPSASVWKLCVQKQKKIAGAPAAYALGDFQVNFGEGSKQNVKGALLLPQEIKRSGFAPLPATEDEVRAIGSLFPGSIILTGEEMTSKKVRETIKGRCIVHFATHGYLDRNHPLFSGLLLSDGILTTSDIFSLDLQAGIVVLSACNTAIGKLSSGDEITGISRAFMYAGSPTVIASLWSVSDESTEKMMKYFYQELKEGRSAAGALQQAQLKVRESYPQPYYWAPFILIGAPGNQ